MSNGKFENTLIRPKARSVIDSIRTALLSGGSWALKSSGLSMEEALASPPEATAEQIFERYREAEVDLIWGAPGAGNLVIKALGGTVKFRPVGPPDVVETCVKSPDKLPELTPDVLQNGSLPVLWDITRHIVRIAKPKYPVAGSTWGPFTLAGLMYGAEKLMRDLRKNPANVYKLLEHTVQLFLLSAELYRGFGVDIMSLAEPMASGDMISRADFDNFILPALKKVFGELKKKELVSILHICGNITDRLAPAAESGADILSVDYKVDIKTAAGICAGKIVLAGNLNPVDVLKDGTPESVRAASIDCLKAAAGCTFILMPGCDIPPATPLENIKAMTRAAHGAL